MECQDSTREHSPSLSIGILCLSLRPLSLRLIFSFNFCSLSLLLPVARRRISFCGAPHGTGHRTGESETAAPRRAAKKEMRRAGSRSTKINLHLSLSFSLDFFSRSSFSKPFFYSLCFLNSIAHSISPREFPRGPLWTLQRSDVFFARAYLRRHSTAPETVARARLLGPLIPSYELRFGTVLANEKNVQSPHRASSILTSIRRCA